MPNRKPDPTADALHVLAELRRNPDVPALVRFLGHRSNLVIAKAAEIAGDLGIAELIPDLVSAFDRLMTNPAKLDKVVRRRPASRRHSARSITSNPNLI